MNKNINIEKEVLGMLINSPNLYSQYKSKLSVNLFTEPSHKLIFDCIDTLWNKNKPIDLSLVMNELMITKRLDLEPYVIGLATSHQYIGNIEHYIMILVELYIKRDFIQKFEFLMNMAKNESQDIFAIRDRAFEIFDNLFVDKFIETNKQSIAFSEHIEKFQEKLKKLCSDTSGITGISSSLNIINKAIGGWQNSDLTVIAGRPGMGKTAFIVQQIIDVATQNIPVGLFSLEMSAEQITARIVTNFTKIKNSSVLRKGLNDDELSKYWACKDDMVKMSIHIDDTPALSMEEIRLKAKTMKMKYGIKILFVDYLQLIRNDKYKSREQEIAHIARGLKNLAKELDIPVVALSQLSRNVESRTSKRPQLSDLRDSGEIEQAADEVIFLYRPEYYNIELWAEYNNEPTANEIEVIIAKNRHGGLLPERYKVDMATSSFYNM